MGHFPWKVRKGKEQCLLFRFPCRIENSGLLARLWTNAEFNSIFVQYLLKPYYNNFNKRITKTPKLYFYDTGVVCALLGIKRADQVAMHAAKGPLFENLVVSELLKDRFNRGESDTLFYWRDKTGHEVDILTENEGKLTAIELKAGETINPDFFKGLDYFSELEAGDIEKRLVYGGNQAQTRSNGIRVNPWNKLFE